MAYIDRILHSGRVTSFGEASASAIVQFQQTHGVELSSAFKTYIQRCNGMSTAFAFDEVREADLHMALADINQIHGIGNGLAHADMALMLPRMDDDAKRLRKVALDIGVGGDLCTFVEISRGRYAKKIMYTDGEMYWSYIKGVDWDAPIDDMIEEFIDDGFFTPVADDFEALLGMYAELV